MQYTVMIYIQSKTDEMNNEPRKPDAKHLLFNRDPLKNHLQIIEGLLLINFIIYYYYPWKLPCSDRSDHVEQSRLWVEVPPVPL